MRVASFLVYFCWDLTSAHMTASIPIYVTLENNNKTKLTYAMKNHKMIDKI